MKKNNRVNIFSTVIALVIVTLISKATGFLREYALATAFGATNVADAYTIALNVPNIIFATFLTAVANCFIPQYSMIKANQSADKSEAFTSNICCLMTLVALVLVVLLNLSPGVVVKIFASGFEGETYTLTCTLVRISSLMMIVMPVSQIYAVYLQANKMPVVAAANNILYNILMIIAFAFAKQIGIVGIALAGSAFFTTQILVQYPYVKKNGHKISLSLSLNEDVKKLIHLMIPVLASTAVVEVNTLIDRSMASGLVSGSVSSLNYAKKLTDLVFGIISVSISSLIYPKMTKLFAENKIEEFKTVFKDSFQTVCILTIPILMIVMGFSKEIVQVVYGRGSFDDNAVLMTSGALFFYAIGMVFSASRDLLIKAFYAMRKTKITMYNSIIATIINIILNIILIRYMKHEGLALASSISFAVTTVLLLVNLNKDINIEAKSMLKDILKATLVAFVLLICMKYSYGAFSPSSSVTILISLATISLLYVFIYIVICYLLKVSAVRSIIGLSMKKRNLERPKSQD